MTYAYVESSYDRGHVNRYGCTRKCQYLCSDTKGRCERLLGRIAALLL